MSKQLIRLIVVTAVLSIWFMVGISHAKLVGHWRCDEGKGMTANDSSGNGNIGILSDELKWKSDGSLFFDEPGGHITVRGASGLSTATSVTVAAWIKPSKVGGMIVRCNLRDPGWSLGLTMKSFLRVRIGRRFIMSRMKVSADI